MSSGPQHYLAAERALEDAEQARRAAATTDLTLKGEQIRLDHLTEAELSLKEAHVHAMLAVAGATIDAPILASGFRPRQAEWNRALTTEITPKKEN